MVKQEKVFYSQHVSLYWNHVLLLIDWLMLLIHLLSIHLIGKKIPVSWYIRNTCPSARLPWVTPTDRDLWPSWLSDRSVAREIVSVVLWLYMCSTVGRWFFNTYLFWLMCRFLNASTSWIRMNLNQKPNILVKRTSGNKWWECAWLIYKVIYKKWNLELALK